MIHVSGHLREMRREDGYADFESPIVINCCGFEKFLTRDYTKQRPGGRVDYQLLYVYKGVGNYKIGHSFTPCSSGSVILYHPGEPQIYSYFSEINRKFTGFILQAASAGRFFPGMAQIPAISGKVCR